MSLLRSVIPAGQMLLISEVVNGAAHRIGEDGSGPMTTKLQYQAVLLGCMFIFGYILDNGIKYHSALIRSRLSMAVNIDIATKINSLEVQHFEDPIVYDRIQRADSNTGSQLYSLFDSSRSTLQAVGSILSVFAVLWSWSPMIAILLISAPVPASMATFAIASREYNVDFNRAGQVRRAAYLRGLLASDSTAKELRLFGIGERLREQYSSFLYTFFQQDRSIARFDLALTGTLGLLSVCANAFAVYSGALHATTEGMVGQLAGYISAIGTLGGSVMMAFAGISMIYQSFLYVSNWVALMDTPEKVMSDGSRDADRSGAFGVEFRDVWFSYPGSDHPVLKGVSCRFESGRVNALVGENGAGKSTVVKLLLRLYEVDSGDILLNGVSLREYSRDSLFEAAAAIFQDFTRFEMSVRENVGFGRLSDMNDDELLWAALAKVGLSEVVQEYPECLDTLLGRRFEGGTPPSIGQWQRFATARALFRKPKLLVLDEPTASVDAASELQLFSAIAAVDEAMTTVLVAHRATTVSHADNILVLEDGCVVDEGSHVELVGRCDVYKTLMGDQIASLARFLHES